MIRLKQQGSSYAQIATIYGISRQRVFQIVSKGKEKLTTKPQGRGLKRFFVGLLRRIRK